MDQRVNYELESNHLFSQRRILAENETVIIGPDDHYGFPLSGNNSSYRSPLALASTATPAVASASTNFPASAAPGIPERAWGPPPPYSRGGSNSETGSISIVSASASMCMSPAHSPIPAGTPQNLIPKERKDQQHHR